MDGSGGEIGRRCRRCRGGSGHDVRRPSMPIGYENGFGRLRTVAPPSLNGRHPTRSLPEVASRCTSRPLQVSSLARDAQKVPREEVFDHLQAVELSLHRSNEQVDGYRVGDREPEPLS